MLKSLQLTNFLSYSHDSPPVELRPLNVLIGTNGSGKSNFVNALRILRAAPLDVHQPIRKDGKTREWLWKGSPNTLPATINAVVENIGGKIPLRYLISFTETDDKAQSFKITDERIEDEMPYSGDYDEPVFHYRYQQGSPVIRARKLPDQQEENAVAENARGETAIKRQLTHESIDHGMSILSQRRDPENYPELAYISDAFNQIRIYQGWEFDHDKIRDFQRADLPNLQLLPDGSNLAPVLNSLRQKPAVKKRILKLLHVLYDGIDAFDERVEAGHMQAFLQEGDHIIPATRLSNGTLQYLCLLAILCNPDPGSLVCIEEPELGLHPDVLPNLAKLLVEASKHTQLIVTTHSGLLVDCFTDTPEAVMVVEREKEGSHINRLSKEDLKLWLEEYGHGLGRLWMEGELGGTRW